MRSAKDDEDNHRLVPSAFLTAYLMKEQKTKSTSQWMEKNLLIFILSIHSPETFLWDSKQNLKVFQLPFMASICPWRDVWVLL